MSTFIYVMDIDKLRQDNYKITKEDIYRTDIDEEGFEHEVFVNTKVFANETFIGNVMSDGEVVWAYAAESQDAFLTKYAKRTSIV